MTYLLRSLETIEKGNAGNKMQGFSLIEMAVVLFIIALLLGGLLPTVSSQIEQQRRNETQKLMTEIRESLLGYVTINGRLPAPACGALQTGSIYAGLELIPASAANTTYCPTAADVAVLPWVTLGVKETDAWGSRFTYRVTPKFASGVIAGTQAAFVLNEIGDITIKTSTTGTPVAASAPVVVISHGAKACGAYLPTGERMNDSTATTPPIYCIDANQQANADNIETYDSIYVNQTASSTFDDMVFWISALTIINRMVTVTKLP